MSDKLLTLVFHWNTWTFSFPRLLKSFPKVNFRTGLKNREQIIQTNHLLPASFRPDNNRQANVWVPAGAGTQVVKEVIQPQVPLRLPCYDFTPVMNHTVVTVLRS